MLFIQPAFQQAAGFFLPHHRHKSFRRLEEGKKMRDKPPASARSAPMMSPSFSRKTALTACSTTSAGQRQIRRRAFSSASVSWPCNSQPKKAYRPAHLVAGKIVFTAGDHAGDAVMPQTFFQQFFLPVGSAEDGDVRKGAYNAPLFGVVCLQHAEAARHESDLTGDGNAFGEIARCGDQAYWTAVGRLGSRVRTGPGLGEMADSAAERIWGYCG